MSYKNDLNKTFSFITSSGFLEGVSLDIAAVSVKEITKYKRQLVDSAIKELNS
tara:strand:- start:172 stop:330 length:159 start_codon:yes stop_codon:yes gene_type:complete